MTYRHKGKKLKLVTTAKSTRNLRSNLLYYTLAEFLTHQWPKLGTKLSSIARQLGETLNLSNESSINEYLELYSFVDYSIKDQSR